MDDPRPRLPSRAIALLTVLLFLGTTVADLVVSGKKRPFGYLASDAYYYLNVARHVVHEGRFAFDGQHATNGFHPLWQAFLVPITAVNQLAHGRPHHLVSIVVVVCTLLIALAIYLLAIALARELGSPTLAFVLLPVGGYGLLASVVWWEKFGAHAHGSHSSVDSLQGTLWSYANGMESGALLLAFAAVAWLVTHKPPFATRRHAIGLGLLLAMVTLARLDHVLIAGAIIAPALWRRDPAERRNGWTAAAAFAVPIGAYALANWIGFGSPMPVSGGLKSSFPHVSTANLGRLWMCLRHPVSQSYYRMSRIEQIVIPMAVALVYLGWAIRARATLGPLARMLAATAVGLWLLGLYDLLYVDLALHGHWYLPVSTLFVSLAALVWLGRWGALRRLERSWVSAGAGVALAATLALLGFVKLHRYVYVMRSYADFYFDKVPLIRQHYGADVPHLLENDDGIVSFATGFPAMAGMGLALDPEGARAWLAGEIIPLAVTRGFNYVTSMAYWNAYSLDLGSPEAQVSAFLQSHLYVPGPERFTFKVDYVDREFAILRVDRRENQPEP
jgi:hypothetical protein